MKFGDAHVVGRSIPGEAKSGDGNIRVVIGDNGLLESLSVNPRALRDGSEAVAELIRATVREAQMSWFRQQFGEGGDWRPARDRLQAKLQEIDALYERRLDAILQRMAELNIS